MKNLFTSIAIFLAIYFSFGYAVEMFLSPSDAKHDVQESRVQTVEKSSYIEYKPEPVRKSSIEKDAEQSVSAATEPAELKVPGKDYSYAHGYYYQFLDSNEQKIYDCIIEACETFTNIVPIPFCTLDEEVFVRRTVRYDHPEYYWMDYDAFYWNNNDGMVYQIKLTIPEDAKQMYSSLCNTADNILAGAPGYANGSYNAYTVSKYLFDYLCLNTTYNLDAGDNIRNAAGPILYHEAVCAGYSDAFKLLCDRAGINCITVLGDTLNLDGSIRGYHAWNMIFIDGQAYWVDVTYGDHDNTECPNYTVFCVDDTSFLHDHVVDTSLLHDDNLAFRVHYPSCNSRNYDFYKLNGMYFRTFAESDFYIRGNIYNGSSFIWLKYETNEELAQAIDYLINYKGIFSYMSEYNSAYTSYRYWFDAQYHTLKLQFV